jgi:hypothetical protein
MPEIKVQFQKISNYSASNSEMSKNVSGIQRELDRLKNSLDWDVKSCSGINNTLNLICRDIEMYSKLLSDMSKYLTSACTEYKKCEDELSGKQVRKSNTNQVPSGAKKDPYRVEWANRFLDAFKEGFFAYNSIILRPFANWIDKGKFIWSDQKGWLKNLDIGDQFGKSALVLANWFKDYKEVATKDFLKYFIGFNDKFDGKASYFDLDKNTKILVDDLAEYYGSALGKFDVALNLGDSIVKNVTEYQKGDISATRACAETVLETGYNVLVNDIIIGTAVAAGMGAAVGSAPVLAVAAITVGIVVGLDYVSNKYTGKDMSELVSDGIIDGAEYVTQEAGKTLKESFDAAVNCFSNPTKIKVPWAEEMGLINQMENIG